MSTLFLIFNHQVTPDQEADAFRSMGIAKITPLPYELQERWRNIPPDLTSLVDYLEPLRVWLSDQTTAGDYVLIQGDFGACYLLVHFALNHGLIPVYSTTQREAEEEFLPGGTVRLIHHFEHQIFRKYGE
jgi:hypothetical protein